MKSNQTKHACSNFKFHLAKTCKFVLCRQRGCPEIILIYSKKNKEYGIPIRDGGSSYIRIDFCPWCGVKL